MRLLERDDLGGLRLTADLPNDKTPPYAILSHVWGPDEVTFKDLAETNVIDKAGYAKLQFCGDQAWKDGLKHFWIDTCCIDKTNSTELQTAINSMFRWYRDSAKCYVYLDDISVSDAEADDTPPTASSIAPDNATLTDRFDRNNLTFTPLTDGAIPLTSKWII